MLLQNSLPKATPRRPRFPMVLLPPALPVRGRFLQEWQVWHKPRDDFPFSPTTKPSATPILPRHAATRLFQMKLPPPTSWAIPTGIVQNQGSAHGARRKSRPQSMLYSVALPVNMPEGPFPRPWTSSPPGMMPLQSRCSPSSSAGLSLPTLQDPPHPGTAAPPPGSGGLKPTPVYAPVSVVKCSLRV